MLLLTGGCGFIGSHCGDALLARGEKLLVLDDLSTGKREQLPRGAELIEADIADVGTLGRLPENITGVIHLAAIASVEQAEREPERTRAVNETATERLARWAAERELPFVFGSSAAVYGDCPELPIAETAPLKPLSRYGRQKLAAEQAVKGAGVCLRFFNVYGPRQDARSPYSGVISLFARRIAQGEAVTLHGDGGQTRDFIHVSDVVQGIVKALDALRGGACGLDAINLCTGRGESIRAVAGLLAELGGKELRLGSTLPRVGDIRHSVGDAGKARQLLGFEARMGLRQGLAGLPGAEAAC